ncbi:MAG: response regulator [Rubrivivax sp.]|nr:response regulator [Rubrivivax sp.]
MKALLADLPIRAKFLLLPAVAALAMLALGVLYVVEQRRTLALQERISAQHVARAHECSRLFSEFSTNHVQFISLLAASFRSGVHEGRFYRAGRQRILVVNGIIEQLRRPDGLIATTVEAQELVRELERRLVVYRDQMGEAVLLSSVDLELIARQMLEANQAYDAANSEFLALVADAEAAIAADSALQVELLQAARWRFFAALSAMLVLIALTSLWLSRRFAADLGALMATLERLSAGDTTITPPAGERRDEFGAVTRTVRAFQQALQRRDEAERERAALNAELEQRVAQRTAQLAAARDEAERANRTKSEFLSRMSHELRTPMNAILGFGQLLQGDPVVGNARAGWVREIVAGGRHLLDLINDVLDLARVESGRFTVSPEPVALAPLIEECLTLLHPQAEAAGVRLHEATRHCDVQVRADRTRLKQVLLNLLSNAVKYNRRLGSVNVVCVAEPARRVPAVCVRVSDTGPGLTRDQQARLFVPFERLDADQRHIEGTGIGLALTKRLVEVMEGEIGVESTPGTGSTFWVRLPLADGGAAVGDRAGPGTAAGDNGTAPAAAAVDVLCIEDNPANLRLIEGILARRPQVRLLSALAPGLGLELARTHRPALILLDIHLPDMDGYAVLQCLREHEATRDIPVLAISAHAMPKDLERAKAAGFVGYVTKPIEVASLLARIDELLAR